MVYNKEYKKVRFLINNEVLQKEEVDEEPEFIIVKREPKQTNKPVDKHSIDINKKMQRFTNMLQDADLEQKQYQYDGVKWCIENEMSPNPIENVRGGFIADEMGLGKTITALGIITAYKLPNTLIVVPPVLIDQWESQIIKITGIQPVVYYGSDRHWITLDDMIENTIVLTTYTMLIKKLSPLLSMKWSRVIFDEAHHLRNKNNRYYACKKLNTHIKWLMTGTPVQNRKQDYYNLCNILGFSESFYIKDENRAIIGKQYVLRRTKAQVGIEMPNMTIENKIVPWTSKEEQEMSEEIHSTLHFSNVSSDKKNGELAQKLRRDGAFASLLRARQSCIMPSLLKDKIGKNSKYNSVIKCSSKLDYVTNFIIERKDNGKGKLVFCHFREEINQVVSRLKAGGIEKVAVMDGRVSADRRKSILTSKYDVLVLQIQTCCEGINLQEFYSEIYFISPNWNPSIEDQAIGRCHRIGQKNDVEVFRFIMSGADFETDSEDDEAMTLEDYINEKQKQKREIGKEMLLE
jgi:SNF2 family DNA or RNA helicase